jgi:SAM-dependent methyltransferase
VKPWSGVGAAYAESYASLCAGTTEAILAALAQSAQRGRLLDVGSGTGALAGAAAAAGWAVTWCEPEATMREVAVADHPDIDVVEGAPPALTFPDAAFDAVIANFVLNHVPDPRASAREMLRVAAPDATMLAEGGWRDVQTTEQTCGDPPRAVRPRPGRSISRSIPLTGPASRLPSPTSATSAARAVRSRWSTPRRSPSHGPGDRGAHA